MFDPNTSTQNLGNLGDVDYKGLEFEAARRASTDSFDAYLGIGYTDSEIKESDRAASDVGNQAPLVSEVQRQPRPAVSSASWRRSAARACSSARTST